MDYLGFLQQDEWEEALTEAKRILSLSSGLGMMEDQCKAVVTPSIKETAPEFRALFWKNVRRLCHFGEGVGGQQVLVSTAEEPIRSSRLSWRTPSIRYTTSTSPNAFRKELGRPADPGRVHNIAAAVGILLGRGTYGLEKHIQISSEEAEIIREEAEDMVLTGPAGRQWHASEILNVLLERDFKADRLDKYALDFLLRKSRQLQRLGRMAWVAADDGAITSATRIDIRQAVISLLEQAGRALSTGEIRQRLVALRGLNETFHIIPVDPVIRVGRGLGVNDRDLPIKRSEQGRLTEHLLDVLRRKGSAVHFSEFHLLKLEAWPSVTPHLAFTLATLDPRLRVSSGQYLYLQEWGDPRRETPVECVRHVLTDAGRPLSIDAIAGSVTVDSARPRFGPDLDMPSIT